MSIRLPSCQADFKIIVITQVLFLLQGSVHLIIFSESVDQRPFEGHLLVFLFGFHTDLLLFFFFLMFCFHVRSSLTNFHSINLFFFSFLTLFILFHQFDFLTILLFSFAPADSFFQSEFSLFLIDLVVFLSFKVLIRILRRISTFLGYNFLHFLNFNHFIL